ncbi:glycoside hydrolase family 2 protein [Isoptericola sp. S6320L]|uniref:glycoside hydrolase family 2 protein n=1 Tax=Isoptericola sp. S6320L TaxID=2926411 RepID=UPI001FF537A7|nr:glycoside hydrolase family 2 protein [Isoptericola sp. S6320L]MCK0116195.1 glycoside hydrolase family 2 protein [Isoptericola sp. S6320L]
MTHPSPRRTAPLHTGWTARSTSPRVPEHLAEHLAGPGVAATVPGCIHTDLLAAGLIPDPYLDDHERLLGWIGRCDWEYTTTFTHAAGPDDARHELAFDGLDTVATVLLNGTEVARTANQHRSYRFDVTELLTDGDNELVVRFTAPVPYADAQSLALGQRPQVNHHPFNAMRKMASNFGWDWGIDVATVGIWRPVRLESWRAARLGAVRVLATASSGTAETGRGTGPRTPDDGARGHLEVRADVAAAPGGVGGTADVSVRLAGRQVDLTGTATVPASGGTAVVHLEVPDVDRWWPRGHGAQPLYDVEVGLAVGGAVVDTWRGRTGFRSTRLDQVPDDDGTSFTLVVNDRPVWVKGANWIPDDAFVHRVDRARYARRLDQAEHAGINLLRVWGGGIYEADDFYELCDERGILTWQDFAFACAAYSEDEPLRSEVEAEARENVARLTPHPSLVLWNGSNENVWGVQEWGWEPLLEGRSWGWGYYSELLPTVVAEVDGTRPYTPSSPWSEDPAVHPNDPDHGSMHSWEVWNRLDWTRYRDDVPRFMAEFGWQGPPTWATLTRAVSDDPLTPESPGMQVHQKAMEGNKKLSLGLVPHLALPDDMEDWHWAMSWNQATAVQVAVEHLRSWAPRCTGSVVWQLNDCWPVTSWAAVDGDERPKPLLFALRHAHADRLVTVQPRRTHGRDGLAAVLVNDSDERWTGDVVVQRLDDAGTELAKTCERVDVAPRSTHTLPLPDDVAGAGEAGGELVRAHLGDVRGLWFFAEPRDSALAAPVLETTVEPTGDGYRLRVRAQNLVRDLTLLADKLHPDARVDDQLVTLLPGEEVALHVTVPDGVTLDAEAMVAPTVLRSLNQLVVAGR